MRIQNISAVNMGTDQEEIASQVLETLRDRDFDPRFEFYLLEPQFIIDACEKLGWNSVPTTGGLIVEWKQGV